MPDEPKRAVVTVVLHSDAPLQFDIVSDDLPKNSKDQLLFSNNRHPGFQVEFEIDDKLELGYRFPPNKDKQEAIWSKLGDSCPSSACNEVFKVTSVRPHRKSLVVHNANVAPVLGEFAYTLRLTKTDGAPYLELDPGGVNQNGPTRSWSSAAMLLTGAAVGSLLTLGAEALSR